MTTDEGSTISFWDQEANDQGLVIVRRTSSGIGLAVSLREDGDIEVFLPRSDCTRLISALQKAVSGEASAQ